MAEFPEIIPNYFPRREPVTEEDFYAEMVAEALKDLLIYGYHMAANGIVLTRANLLIADSILDTFDDEERPEP